MPKSKERSSYGVIITLMVLSIFVSLYTFWFVTYNTEKRLMIQSHNLRELESRFQSLEKTIRFQSNRLIKKQKDLEYRILNLDKSSKQEASF